MAAAYTSPPSTKTSTYRAPNSSSTSNAPQGTFLPGTKVQVGSHRVVIERYLSEGGFAHVYVVRIPRDGNKYELAVLKRVAVPDKDHLANMKTEVETMKKLKGHKHIVTYIDSHASQLKGGGYEVFLLMEFCQGGGLIDFMNTRLQHRLIELEILKIFGDVSEGLACMHYLRPPLLHRDLKVENVLISKGKDGVPLYKLADFGSTAPPRPAATTAEEGRLIEDDVQKHTTMQYRSPEMIDVWRKRPIDEKADIWAMGVFLYKLCYYTTPFEEVGQMAILNATFKYPAYPQFSSRLKKLIGSMLKEDPRDRPNIYQVIKEVCSMRGTDVPVKDIYTDRTHSEARRNEVLPGLQRAATKVEEQSIPDIVPMRRGRPGASKADISPSRGDPFAALDSKKYEERVVAVDELSKRFPSLDDFDIVQKKEPFQFGKKLEENGIAKVSLSTRVTNALADEVFAKKEVVRSDELFTRKESVKSGEVSAKKEGIRLDATSTKKEILKSLKPVDTIPRAISGRYTSTGTGTSPPEIKIPEVKKTPIWRVPSHSRSTSHSRTETPSSLPIHRSKSQTSDDDTPDVLTRAQTTQARIRPSSAYLSSNLDFLRDQEGGRRTSGRESARHSRQPSPGVIDDVDDIDIQEDTDLKRRNSRKGSGGLSFGHRKRNSLPSISGAISKLGDAFKRSDQEPRTPKVEEAEPALSPIAGSDTPDILVEDVPEIRRELERRRLDEEERRVAEAAREYRERVATNGTGPVSRGTAIQQRVQTLLDGGSRSSSPVKRTAEGYGRYTDEELPPRSSSLNKPLAKKPLPTATIVQPRTRPQEKPSAPPKPKVLRTSQWPPEADHDKPLPPQPSGLAALLAKDLEGVPDYPPREAGPSKTQEDLEAEFSRRYPSLSGIEMVETDLNGVARSRDN